MARGLRFGYQLCRRDEADPITAARRAEALGFDTVLASDHVGPGVAPMPTLAAVATATSTIRIGTFVLNVDMRDPVQLAWEAATIDRLSGGRFELGLGAGHTPQEYATTGITFDPPSVRKRRLAERVEIIRQLLDGETVTFNGEHHRIAGAQLDRSTQPRLPIMVGGNGAALLAHAGRHADIIGLQGLGRTRPDGHNHAVRWSQSHLDDQIEQIRHGAGGRFDQLELNALVQVVEITDDAPAAIARWCGRIEGLDPGDAAAIPYLLIGTVAEIQAKIERCRVRWGITYFVVRELDAFEPVIAHCRSVG